MPKSEKPQVQPDTAVDEVVEALLHSDRARHDELGRTRPELDEPAAPSGPREQAAAPIDMEKVDE